MPTLVLEKKKCPECGKTLTILPKHGIELCDYCIYVIIDKSVKALPWQRQH